MARDSGSTGASTVKATELRLPHGDGTVVTVKANAATPGNYTLSLPVNDGQLRPTLSFAESSPTCMPFGLSKAARVTTALVFKGRLTIPPSNSIKLRMEVRNGWATWKEDDKTIGDFIQNESDVAVSEEIKLPGSLAQHTLRFEVRFYRRGPGLSTLRLLEKTAAGDVHLGSASAKFAPFE